MLDADVWNPDHFRLHTKLSVTTSVPYKLPHHRPGEPFLKGPITFAWISTACQLPGVGLHVATALRFLDNRYQGKHRWDLDELAIGLQVCERTARVASMLPRNQACSRSTANPGASSSRQSEHYLAAARANRGRCMGRYLGPGGISPCGFPDQPFKWPRPAGWKEVGNVPQGSSSTCPHGRNSVYRGPGRAGGWILWLRRVW